jgi:putative peptide zinc metalloprotease protein
VEGDALSGPLLSDSWYRMRQLRPRLRGHLRIHRHEYRGEVWYVIEDRIGVKHQRFNFQAYRVIHLMDGTRTMDEVWEVLCADLSDDTPTQGDVLKLLSTLHSADLVQVDVTPDVAELLQRRKKQVRSKWMARVGNPLGIRIPLYDADALLNRMVQGARRITGARSATPWVLAWLAVVLPALFMVPAQWSALTAHTRDQLLATDNLVMLALLFPLVKLVHEFGHGLVCKAFGGEVHETGVMLLVLYPVPYVDASNSSTFVDKWHRALVGAAGMLAELVIAAIAFYVWLLLEPGTARGVAYNVAVLASVTTLFFNANPLLRFDGYYILIDLIESPNLGSRANRYWQYLAERYLFGVKRTEPPQATAGERRWFAFYAPVSYVYRLVISFTIALFIATQVFFLGVLMAIWTLLQSVAWPMFKGVKALATGPQFADRSARIRGLAGSMALAVVLLLFVLPLPHHTMATGVIWLPEHAIVRAESAGFVRQLVAQPGAQMAQGQPVLEMVEPGLATRIAVQDAKAEELRVQVDAAWGQSQAKVQQLEQQLAREKASLARLQDEARRLTLRTHAAGTLLVQSPEDLPGRYLKQGDVVGYLHTADAALVRLVVPQGEVDPVRQDTRAVEIRPAQDTSVRWTATLARSAPAAVHQLPSPVLGAKGGGPMPTDPRDDKGLATLESVFEFELLLPPQATHDFLGSRVHVRFEHEPEPIGWRIGRAVRRLFLSQFST